MNLSNNNHLQACNTHDQTEDMMATSLHQPVIITAKLNRRLVYRRCLKGYLSLEGLELAIHNTIHHSYRGFDVEVYR